MRKFDVVIVGNGIIGFSMAYSLIQADPRLRIAIIGPHQATGSASRAAGAMLGCFGEVTHATFTSAFNLAKLNIAIQAAKLWPSWIEKLNNYLPNALKVQLRKGTYVILNTTSGEIDNQNFDAIIHALNHYQEPYQITNPTDIPYLKPISNHRPLRAVYIPNEGAINPKQLINGFQKILQELKVDYLDGRVRELQIQSNIATGINLESGEAISAGHVILCCGAYTQPLIDKVDSLRYRIPRILSGVDYGLVFSLQEQPFSSAVIRTPNRAGACGIHFVPRDPHNFYFGASNYLTPHPTERLRSRYLYYLLQYATEQINQNIHDAEIEELTIGNRPVTIDTYPLVGKTSIKGLWLLTGTYRDGLHDSPVFTKILATQLLHPTIDNENLFLPERALIATRTLKQSIEETVQHFMSTGYEHSMQLPRMGWDEMLYSLLKTRITEIASKLDINFGVAPEILIMLNRLDEQYIDFFRTYFKRISAEFSITPEMA